MARDPNSYTHTETLDEEPDENPDETHDDSLDDSLGENLGENFDDRHDESADGAAQNDGTAAGHRMDGSLDHDLERTGHVLGYVESVSGEYAARQLSGVMQDSRSLTGVRQMWGDPTAYAEDTHEQYVQCIMDLPATLEAKQAMAPEKWDDNQLQEAVLHEVNRMGYRLNLEIRDRFMNQFDHRRGIVRFAQDRGVADELLEMVDCAGEGKEHWVRGERTSSPPTRSRIEVTANFYIIEIGLVNALEERDESTAEDFVNPVRGGDDLQARAGRAMAYVPPEEQEIIREALEIAAHWTDGQIQDGALDYHAQYGNLDFRPSTDARERWLADTGQTETKREMAGDCSTRALNEATGGQDYGDIWQEITRHTQSEFPEKDADDGVSNLHFREIYEQHGMKLLLPRSVELNHIMRKHLDLREIPALLGGLVGEGEPLTCIACSEGHAVALVDGVVHDNWDSRDMGEPGKYLRDGKLVELWLKTDDQEVVEGALDILGKYETVRQYDDVLTYGRRRRETIPPPTPRELLEV